MAVEVSQTEEGLVGSKYEATIVDLRQVGATGATKEALVEYKTLFAESEPRTAPSKPATANPTVCCIVPGQCATPGCTLADFHLGPCTPFLCDDGPRARARKGEPPETRLREWVRVASLSAPPEAARGGWHEDLDKGSKAEMRHEGGFWRVTVRERLPQRQKKGVRYVVRVDGYAVEHTVGAASLRPRAA